MSTIEELYLRAKEAHNQSKNRLLRIDEVKEIVTELWSELFNFYEENSIEWRIIDKGRTEHTDWWSVPTTSDYAKEMEATNLEVIIKVIEKITGETKSSKTNIKQKEIVENHQRKLDRVTGRTKWDFLSELHRHYKLWFILVGIILLLILGWP